MSVAHSNVLLALIRMRGQTPNQHDLMKLNVPKFKHSHAAEDAQKTKTCFAQEEEMHTKDEASHDVM